MKYVTDYHAHTGVDPARWYKTTLFQSPRLLLGLDCLEPGQAQAPHQHAGRDKFYFVIEGEGEFTVGGEVFHAKPGAAVWAPADTVHGVANTGPGTLIMLIGMAPEPG